MTKHWTVLVTASLATLLALFAPAPVARADIFEWEYINPANPAQGKQQSTTLAPDGAGVNAVPGANLSDRNLTMAYLIGADLTGAYARAYQSDQRGPEPGQPHECELLWYATLTGANLTRGRSAGGEFSRRAIWTGITTAQLYSTASYQAHDLTGIASERRPDRRELSPARTSPTPTSCHLSRHADQCQFQPGQPHECELRGAPR